MCVSRTTRLDSTPLSAVILIACLLAYSIHSHSLSTQCDYNNNHINTNSNMKLSHSFFTLLSLTLMTLDRIHAWSFGGSSRETGSTKFAMVNRQEWLQKSSLKISYLGTCLRLFPCISVLVYIHIYIYIYIDIDRDHSYQL